MQNCEIVFWKFERYVLGQNNIFWTLFYKAHFARRNKIRRRLMIVSSWVKICIEILNSDFFTSPADHIATMLFCDIFPNAFSEDHINDFFSPLIEGKLNLSMKIKYFTYSSFLKRKHAHGRNSEISKFASKP